PLGLRLWVFCFSSLPPSSQIGICLHLLMDEDLKVRMLMMRHGKTRTVDGEEEDFKITHLSERQNLKLRE
ncbi:hypothetical protein, partial [Escherichia coli]|uniref:hypothetical protein n=1 Tax=Escherichia coli TaxID=562 RepID=UPI002001D881